MTAHRSLPVVLALALLQGCAVGIADPAILPEPGDPPPVSLLDAGQGTPIDAGAGLPPRSDAGTGADAGRPAVDAGPPVVDAGQPPVDAGTGPCDGVVCGSGAQCHPSLGRCLCSPGFTGDGTTCAPVMPGTPEAHTEGEVCQAWRSAQTRREAGDGFSVGGASCDRGALTRNAIDDALARLNFFRWLIGVGPTTDDVGSNDTAQACALVSAWNPAGQQAHHPQPSATCYTSSGAAGAGSSNIAWGSGDAADAIDQWMIDNGNFTTFGHRRWLLSPPLNPVGIGFYRGGNNYGSASCITVFSASGTGPSPAVTAFPPPGYSPTALTHWVWTVHGAIPLAGVAATVTRLSDGASLPVTVQVLQGNYGHQSAVSISRQGWTPVAGQTYHVTLSGSGTTPAVEYDVKPTDCP